MREIKYMTYWVNGEEYNVWYLNGRIHAQHIGFPMTALCLHLDIEKDIIDDEAIRKAIEKDFRPLKVVNGKVVRS